LLLVAVVAVEDLLAEAAQVDTELVQIMFY
jgi:hypothetical protein